MITNITKKALPIAVIAFSGLVQAQSLQDAIIAVDSHKYAQARNIYSKLSTSDKNGDTYFYLGNTYLTQAEPDFAKAEEEFKKGLAISPKSPLIRLGLASAKLGKGDKSAIVEIQNIVKDSREKDPEILFRAAQALTQYDNFNAPALAIEYLDKAIAKTKGPVPAYYYYSKGDAYRLLKDPGKAMTAYENALPLAKNKASVYTRMGTLWMAAQQWKLALEKINQAIASDPTYAPAYRAKADYNIKYQENLLATQDLLNYEKYADEDPYTKLELAKLFFTNKDYSNSQSKLNLAFDKVNDPIKYKLRSYLTFLTSKDYASADADMKKFISSSAASRVQPADKGLQGLILAGLAEKEQDATKKAAMLNDANTLIKVATDAKDMTLDWNAEVTKLKGGGYNMAAVNAGPTNATIDDLRKKITANPKDLNAWVSLGTEYQKINNWEGALWAWQNMASESPSWDYAYFGQGVAQSMLKKDALAKMAFQQYTSKMNSKPVADQMADKNNLSYAYYMLSYYEMQNNKPKALEYINKALQYNPEDADALKMKQILSK